MWLHNPKQAFLEVENFPQKILSAVNRCRFSITTQWCIIILSSYLWWWSGHWLYLLFLFIFSLTSEWVSRVRNGGVRFLTLTQCWYEVTAAEAGGGGSWTQRQKPRTDSSRQGWEQKTGPWRQPPTWNCSDFCDLLSKSFLLLFSFHFGAIRKCSNSLLPKRSIISQSFSIYRYVNVGIIEPYAILSHELPRFCDLLSDSFSTAVFLCFLFFFSEFANQSRFLTVFL